MRRLRSLCRLRWLLFLIDPPERPADRLRPRVDITHRGLDGVVPGDVLQRKGVRVLSRLGQKRVAQSMKSSIQIELNLIVGKLLPETPFPSRSKLIKHVRELCWLEARPTSSRPSIYLADLCQGTTLSQCPVSASRTVERQSFRSERRIVQLSPILALSFSHSPFPPYVWLLSNMVDTSAETVISGEAEYLLPFLVLTIVLPRLTARRAATIEPAMQTFISKVRAPQRCCRYLSAVCIRILSYTRGRAN
jgi:hypothetical protein